MGCEVEFIDLNSYDIGIVAITKEEDVVIRLVNSSEMTQVMSCPASLIYYMFDNDIPTDGGNLYVLKVIDNQLHKSMMLSISSVSIDGIDADIDNISHVFIMQDELMRNIHTSFANGVEEILDHKKLN